MEGNADLWLGKAGEQSIGNHVLRSANRLLSRLSHHHQCAVPLAFGLCHDVSRSDPGSHVDVVSTGVHHVHFSTGVVFRRHLAGIRQTCLLFNGKSIELGAQHNDRAVAIAQNTDHTGATNVFSDIVAKLAELCGEFGSSVDLVRRKLRVLVQVNVKRLHLGIDRLNLSGQRSAAGGCHLRPAQRSTRADKYGCYGADFHPKSPVYFSTGPHTTGRLRNSSLVSSGAKLRVHHRHSSGGVLPRRALNSVYEQILGTYRSEERRV